MFTASKSYCHSAIKITALPGGQPNKRSPAEYSPYSPPNYSGADLPVMGNTPSWMTWGRDQPGNGTPSPLTPLPSYALPPLEMISVPPQAKHLHVVPTEEDDPVLRDHVPRTKGSKRKEKPQNIRVVPASRPIALVTARTPSVQPPSSAVAPRTKNGRSPGRSAPGTPRSPEPSPYIDPGLATGLPRALGLQAFPIRAERAWRHGG
ncbi:hypothetical protein B0H14DRAFT_2880789 [Mycena olivaceomarginata]|nr:hypothetical protein B0H14DRAFT_2992812 [Mycena olivaceomarginata]KAJ7805401.1 hypothetical protein B0H14DRAFT_2880789 [Mycena olivaceomarginata]